MKNTKILINAAKNAANKANSQITALRTKNAEFAAIKARKALEAKNKLLKKPVVKKSYTLFSKMPKIRQKITLVKNFKLVLTIIVLITINISININIDININF